MEGGGGYSGGTARGLCHTKQFNFNCFAVHLRQQQQHRLEGSSNSQQVQQQPQTVTNTHTLTHTANAAANGIVYKRQACCKLTHTHTHRETLGERDRLQFCNLF